MDIASVPFMTTDVVPGRVRRPCPPLARRAGRTLFIVD